MECYKNLNIEDMDNEIWRDVKGYEGLYKVSNYGRVKSLSRLDCRGQRIRERILKQVDNTQGYLQVMLYKEGKGTTMRVNRLVAIAFLENPQGLSDVNHIDEVKSNNTVSNLEWCTCKDNINHGTRNKRSVEKNTNHPKKSKAVIGTHKITGEVVSFPSTKEAERVLGIDNGNISKCCNRKLKSVGGYVWHYVED